MAQQPIIRGPAVVRRTNLGSGSERRCAVKRHPRPLELLVQEFAKSVLARTQATREGNSRKAHSTSSGVVKTWDELWEGYGDAGLEKFAALLQHPDQQVRVDAAVYMLDYRPQVALRVLEEEAPTHGGAQMTLERWRAHEGKI